MLFVGRQRERTCQTLTRRAFLQAGASTVLGLSLADMLRLRAMGGAPMAGSARSVLLLWLWGGPAHLDTWEGRHETKSPRNLAAIHGRRSGRGRRYFARPCADRDPHGHYVIPPGLVDCQP